MTQPTVSSLQDDGPSFMTAHAEATWLRQKLAAAKMRIADLEATIARMEANAAQATQNALGTYWDQDRRITELVAQLRESQWKPITPELSDFIHKSIETMSIGELNEFDKKRREIMANAYRPPRGEREGEKP